MNERTCDDWLATYIEYTKHQESPEIFHLWSGISIISSVLGRTCWVDRGYYFTFPNHYIVIVSPSALCKKSTAVNIAINIHNEVFPEDHVYSKKITLQKFILNLEKQFKTKGEASGFIYNSELSVLIGRSGTNELMDFLTDVYECPNQWSNETKGKGVDRLHNLFVNMIACTTPKDLATMPAIMIDGGFSGRTIFVYSDSPRPPIHNPRIHFDADIGNIRENLIMDLNEMKNISGEYTLTAEADECYKEIYEQNYYNRDTDFRLHPYQGRKGEHLIKLAMVIAASSSNSLILTPRHIEIANTFLKQIESKLTDTFSFVEYSSSASTKNIDKFLYLLKQKDGYCSHSVALNKLYHYVNKDEMKIIVDTLEEGGRIQTVLEGRKKFYKLLK